MCKIYTVCVKNIHSEFQDKIGYNSHEMSILLEFLDKFNHPIKIFEFKLKDLFYKNNSLDFYYKLA